MKKTALALMVLSLAIIAAPAFCENMAEGVLDAGKIVMRNDYKIIVNGVETKPDVPPIQKGGMIFIPLRFAAESLKAVVDWNEARKQVTLTFPGGRVETMRVGDTEIVTPDGSKIIPYPPFVFENRVMLPLKPTAEGGIYLVDEKPDSMTITSDEKKVKGLSEDTDQMPGGVKMKTQSQALQEIRNHAKNDKITNSLKPYVRMAWAAAFALWLIVAIISAAKGRPDGWKDMIIIFVILVPGVIMILSFMYSTYWAAMVAIGTCVVGMLSTETYEDKLVTMASTAQGIGLICTLFGLGLLIGPAIANRDISAIGYGIYVKIEPTITGLFISLLLNLMYGMEAKKISQRNQS